MLLLLPCLVARQPLPPAGHRGLSRAVEGGSPGPGPLSAGQSCESVGKGLAPNPAWTKIFHLENELLPPRQRARSLWLRTLAPVEKPLIVFQLLCSQEHSGQSSQETAWPQAQPQRAGPVGQGGIDCIWGYLSSQARSLCPECSMWSPGNPPCT